MKKRNNRSEQLVCVEGKLVAKCCVKWFKQQLEIEKSKKKHIKYTDRLIELTDRNGNITYVDDNMVLAKALNVCIEAINCVLAKKRKYVRGCKIRVVDSVTLKPIEK